MPKIPQGSGFPVSFSSSQSLGFGVQSLIIKDPTGTDVGHRLQQTGPPYGTDEYNLNSSYAGGNIADPTRWGISSDGRSGLCVPLGAGLGRYTIRAWGDSARQVFDVIRGDGVGWPYLTGVQKTLTLSGGFSGGNTLEYWGSFLNSFDGPTGYKSLTAIRAPWDCAPGLGATFVIGPSSMINPGSFSDPLGPDGYNPAMRLTGTDPWESDPYAPVYGNPLLVAYARTAAWGSSAQTFWSYVAPPSSGGAEVLANLTWWGTYTMSLDCMECLQVDPLNPDILRAYLHPRAGGYVSTSVEVNFSNGHVIHFTLSDPITIGASFPNAADVTPPEIGYNLWPSLWGKNTPYGWDSYFYGEIRGYSTGGAGVSGALSDGANNWVLNPVSVSTDGTHYSNAATNSESPPRSVHLVGRVRDFEDAPAEGPVAIHIVNEAGYVSDTTDAAGDYDRVLVQNHRTYKYTSGGVWVTPPAVDEWGPVSVTTQESPNPLGRSGFLPAWIHTKAYDSFQISQPDSQLVDDCKTPALWTPGRAYDIDHSPTDGGLIVAIPTAGANVLVGQDGAGNVTLDVTGTTPGSVTLNLPALQRWDGYRWLHLDIESSVAAVATMQMITRFDNSLIPVPPAPYPNPVPEFSGREWRLLVKPDGSSPVDLMFTSWPTQKFYPNGSGGWNPIWWDNQDSQFAEQSTYLDTGIVYDEFNPWLWNQRWDAYMSLPANPYLVPDSWTWGVSFMQQLVIKDLSPGFYTLKGITLQRHTHRNLRFVLQDQQGQGVETNWLSDVPSLQVLYEHGGGQTIWQQYGYDYGYRVIQGNTDGKASLDAYTTGYRSVSETVEYIGSLPSWAVADLAPTDAFWNNDRNGRNIAGGGLVYTAGIWTSYLNVDASATRTIPTQLIFRGVDFYPGCGDLFGLAAAPLAPGDPLPLAFHQIRKQAVYGLTYGAAGPKQGVVVGVEWKDVVGGTGGVGWYDGVGTSDVNGEYLTQSPYIVPSYYTPYTTAASILSPSPPPAAPFTNDFQISPLGYDTDVFVYRLIWRPPLVTLGLLFNLHSPSGEYWAGDCFTGDARLYWSHHATPPYALGPLWATTEGGVSAASLARDAVGLLHILYVASGDVYRRSSTDRGLSWSDRTMAFSGGVAVAQALSWDGLVLIRAAVVGGVIQGTEQSSGMTTPSTAWTFVDTTGSPLLVDGSGFGLSQGWGVDRPWLLHMRIQGESDSSDWVSNDFCRSWRRIA